MEATLLDSYQVMMNNNTVKELLLYKSITMYAPDG